MILPIALVERWPGEEYRLQHSTIESALKHNVADALRLYHDVNILKEIESTWQDVNAEGLDKQGRYDLKRQGDTTLDRRVSAHIIEKDEKLTRLIS